MSKEIYHEGWLIKSPPKKSIWLPKVSHLVIHILFFFLCIQIYFCYLYLIFSKYWCLSIVFIPVLSHFVCDKNNWSYPTNFRYTYIYNICSFACQPIVNGLFDVGIICMAIQYICCEQYNNYVLCAVCIVCTHMCNGDWTIFYSYIDCVVIGGTQIDIIITIFIL